MKCWEENQKEEDLRCGVIASAIYNSAFKKRDGMPFVPEDFFPRLQESSEEKQATKEFEQQIEFMRAFGCPPEKIQRLRELGRSNSRA